MIDYLMIKFLLGNPYGTSSQKVQSISFFLWKNNFFFFFFEKKSIDRNEGKLTGGHLIKIWDNCSSPVVTSSKMKVIFFVFMYCTYLIWFFDLSLCLCYSMCLCVLYLCVFMSSCFYVFYLCVFMFSCLMYSM